MKKILIKIFLMLVLFINLIYGACFADVIAPDYPSFVPKNPEPRNQQIIFPSEPKRTNTKQIVVGGVVVIVIFSAVLIILNNDKKIKEIEEKNENE